MSKIGVADRSIPVPSQRSVVCAAALAEAINSAFRVHFEELIQNGASLDIDAELSNVWWRLLYQNDFDDWMVTQAKTTFEFVWLDVLVKLRNQSFFYSYGNPHGGVILPDIPEIHRSKLPALGKFYLSRLIALFIREGADLNLDLLHRAQLLRSLDLDGISVDLENLRLIQNEGPISLDDEKTELEKLLDESRLPDQITAASHLKSASSHYMNGQDHSSLGESRTFLESLLKQVAEGIGAELNRACPGGMRNQIGLLTDTHFFTSDEETAFLAAWGFLSSGSHPGLPERVQARLGMVLSLEFGQALLMKWLNRHREHGL